MEQLTIDYQFNPQSINIAHIRHWPAKDQALKWICENQSTDEVKTMHLDQFHLTWKGMLYLGRSNWSNVTNLHLYHNKLGSKGCKYLSRIAFNSLWELGLSMNRIEATGMLHLSKASWTKLYEVYLMKNSITGGLKHLVKARWSGDALFMIAIAFNELTLPQMLDLMLLESNNVGKMILHHNKIQVSKKVALQRTIKRKLGHKIQLFI